MSSFNQNASFSGLGTFSITVQIAGPYFLEGKISLPTLTNGGGASSCLVTINQNGSPIYTGLAGAEGFKKDTLCAAGDVLAIVLSSSAPADQPLNAIKTVIAIGQGV